MYSMPQTVSIRVTHFSHMVSTLVANVYVNNLGERLLRESLLPCYKKLKKQIFQEVGDCLN